jgi:hypothetical protein
MKDKIFYKFIVKHFIQQLHDYFIARIPQETVGVGGRVELNKWTHITGGVKIDKNGVIHGRTTEKHYNKGWNDCVKEMKSRVL